MREWWWRVRCAWWYWWEVPWLTADGAIDAAWAGDYDAEYPPRDSVNEDLSYWTE